MCRSSPSRRPRLPRAALPGPALALLLAVAGCGPAAEPADLVVRNVHVVDVAAGEVVRDRTVVVDGGRIRSILPSGGGAAGEERDGAEPPAERVVEGEGRYLLPGLWDAHVHFRGGPELAAANRDLLPLYVANGVTTVRDAGGDLTAEILEWRGAITRGEAVGPRILTSGPKLDGPDPSWEGSLALASPDEVPAALDSLQALGADYVKIYDGSISPEVYLAIVGEAEARGMTVTGHMPLSLPFLEAVEAGLDATEHLYYAFKGASPVEDSITAAVAAGDLGFWGALEAVRQAHDPESARATWEAMARHGTAVVPTLHIGDVLARVDEVDHTGDPELRFVPPEVEATYARRVESARRASPEARARNRALRDTLASLVHPMHEAGVTVLAGSDAGPFNSYVYPGFSLHRELEALVEAGLTPAEALRSATIHPARFMGLGEVLGRVAPGYVADLVLVDGDPLAEITATRSVSGVVLAGDRVLDAGDLAELLEAVAR